MGRHGAAPAVQRAAGGGWPGPGGGPQPKCETAGRRSLFRVLPQDPRPPTPPTQPTPHAAPPACLQIRIYRYQPGQKFGRHIDESNELGGKRYTQYTLLIYLSHCGGGQTVFYGEGPRRGGALQTVACMHAGRQAGRQVA